MQLVNDRLDNPATGTLLTDPTDSIRTLEDHGLPSLAKVRQFITKLKVERKKALLDFDEQYDLRKTRNYLRQEKQRRIDEAAKYDGKSLGQLRQELVLIAAQISGVEQELETQKAKGVKKGHPIIEFVNLNEMLITLSLDFFMTDQCLEIVCLLKTQSVFHK